VNKAELLDELAVKAAEHGVEPPSEAKLESWVSKKLVTGAKPKGQKRAVAPDWSYSDDSVERCLALVAMEARGFKRTNQLRLGLAAEGFDIDPTQLRESLEVEAVRSIKRMRRDGLRNYVPSDHPEEFANLSTAQRRLTSKVDPLLNETGFVLPQDLMFAAINSAIGGTSENPLQTTEYQTDVERHLNKVIPGGLPFDPTQLPLHIIPNLMAGMLGIEDETDLALANRVRNATDAQLLGAVEMFRELKQVIEILGAFAQAFPEPTPTILMSAFADPNWLPLMLSLLITIADPTSNSDEISAIN